MGWCSRRRQAAVFLTSLMVTSAVIVYRNQFASRSEMDLVTASNVNKESIRKAINTKDLKHLSDGDNEKDDYNLWNMKWSMPLGPALKLTTINSNQSAIVNAIKHAWRGYKNHAWGTDELLPVSKKGTSSGYGLGMTMVDCLDTLWLAGLQEEFDEAREWVKEHLDISRVSKSVSLFETTIRVLGGLLSAYHLSLDRLFLNKAVELANHLLPAFDTPSGVPAPFVNLQSGVKGLRSLSVAEAGTLQLEFRDISHSSGNTSFQSLCDRDMDVLLKEGRGLLMPGMVSPRSGKLQRTVYTVGAGIDSYYEYLLKQWLQSGKVEEKFLTAYLSSVQEVSSHLVGHTAKSNLAFVGKLSTKGSPPLPVMDHLSCFYPGMLALGLYHGLHSNQRELADSLTETCFAAYNASPSGLAPEIFELSTQHDSVEDLVIKGPLVDASNKLRPETVESIFYQYRLTKDEKYRDWGWRIFQAFEKHTRVASGGYTGVWSVINTGKKMDKMESFFISETLKYLFLLFSDDSVMPLDQWVFNTEAHPLPIWTTNDSEAN